ncbi:purine and uridine phosphorylase [Setomelanomma holmii]|uniref:Purine and uridine phosphorylase n=1 Tax=Setomelanomma holmii TaxID=210430 RepID=A0A9P4GTX3_9PLEO|nr:purine and uridine phosphorylase [Setomelanomma holmii]
MSGDTIVRLDLSNGFVGHNVRLDCDRKVETYTHWSRFTVKQTYDKLMPKRTFTPHVANYYPGLGSSSNTIAEWYEMGFFAFWKPLGSLTLLCFDLPIKSQSRIQSMIGSHTIDISNPYSAFLLISDELLRLYDDSVWSIRNHISQWEAKRLIETDYARLHEIARHGVHVNETLSVAMRSLDNMVQQHREFCANANLPLNKGKCNRWNGISSRMSFQLQFLENLLQRSSANNAQIQNIMFTIGWISPLPLEKEAARLALDEEYPQEDVHHQNTFYLGGRMGQHRVIIGVQRKIGLSGAAVLAEKMRAGFPNIKYFVLVGIAGGVPRYGPTGASSEIVLGDVVVSSPRGNHGGVLQYDKGAWQGKGRLNFRGHTNGQFDDPGPTCDRLFKDEYDHQGTKLDDCKDCYEPFVHFGNIASSNQLQISARERNRVQLEHEAICFEIEAAGVMEEYPCVVIRGICDYADSHKNKGWQKYAAATAAAYAKGLLSMIPAIDVPDSGTTANASPQQPTTHPTNVTFGNQNSGQQAGVINGGVHGAVFGRN